MGGCGSGSSTSGSAATTTVVAKAQRPAAGKDRSGGSGEGSISRYGAVARGSSKAVVITAVHSFLTDMAKLDYEGLCAVLAKPNREELTAFVGGKSGSGGCSVALKTLLDPSVASEAEAAAEASITSVRIKDGTAFALFTPKGGSPSYVVMKREGDGWKAISLAPGSSIEPGVNP